jgi:hypothetical protein
MKEENRHLVFRLVQFGIDRKQFTFSEMFEALDLSPDEEQYIKKVVWDTNRDVESGANKLLIKVPRLGTHENDWKYMLLPDAVFQYVDYLEIIEARKAAKSARTLSWIAIIITLVLGVLQTYFQLSAN